MKKLVVATLVVSTLASVSVGTPSYANDPVLTKATLSTYTTDEDKDWNTCVFVEVTTSDGNLVAHASGQDCNNADGTQYKDGSNHEFDLTIDSPGLLRSYAKGFKVHMWQETHSGRGHDTWRFNARVALLFSSGAPPLTASVNGAELVSKSTADRPSVDLVNPS